MRKLTLHAFSNGAALLQFDGDMTPTMVEMIREGWDVSWKAARERKERPVFHIHGMEIEVIEHQSPLGEEPFSFDAISHAFGALGEYKEDEEIEAFIEALRSYYT